MSEYILIDGTLYHHGIKGQKWGLRRYQNEDGSLTAAGREHYGYGNRIADRISRPGLLSGSQGISKKSNLRSQSIYQKRGERALEKASKAKTKLGKAYYTQKGNNNLAIAKMHETKAQQSLGKRLFDSTIVNTQLLETPYYTLAGRKTTYGQRIVDDILGLSTYKDAKYLYDQGKDKREAKKTAKQEYKERDKKIQDNYYKEMEKIEKGYKRGQMLSEKDQKREIELDKKAQKAWADSKKEYKEALNKIKNG